MMISSDTTIGQLGAALLLGIERGGVRRPLELAINFARGGGGFVRAGDWRVMLRDPSGVPSERSWSGSGPTLESALAAAFARMPS